MKFKSAGALVSAAFLTAGLSGCATNSGASGGAAKAEADNAGKPIVYTSTDVWASVAKAVTGDLAEVKTSIDQPNQDPHSYEVSVKDKQLVNDASVVIVNGGGYDDWAIQLADSAKAKPVVLNAVEISGIDCETAEEDAHEHGDDEEHAGETDEHDHENEATEKNDDHAEDAHAGHHHCAVNEHVFYDLDTVSDVAEKLAESLGKTDKTNAKAYRTNAKAFEAKLDALEEKADAIEERGEKHSLATEPLANYLLEDAGVHDITPAAYVEQSETESGPSVKTQAETKALLTQGKVDVLLVNAQTEDPVSKALQEEAKAKGIPLVTMNETLAGASDYVSWIGDALDQLDAALK
ncbi:MAG: zinc ABC transporter substrate-binding protein [Mobiluncus porci]|uniref:metal ABC transporter solute-binding protein, Zn/Mn family n=1 Tax=Mobiluncus porci TaxID=2652278 RepID=UPI0023F007EE|nr:zinc ABC transporter substrate-binding protein [Mobiluncus porci]MDD7542347.1 zinc ABC transporter substrate-binding protein [Mobiluncus porci]MDY5749146.1 zinc ABC transporter substrate-binding protein [Mobiluncus porci]